MELAPSIEIVTDVRELTAEIATYPMAGHTEGCIGVLDMRTRTLISGDGLQGAGVDKYRCTLASPEDYRETLAAIRRDERIETILLSHAYEPWYTDVIRGRAAVVDCVDRCEKIAFASSKKQ